MPGLKIYLAAASSQWQEARRLIELLAPLGYVQTHDWTLEIEHLVNTGKPPLTPEGIVAADLGGVLAADVLVLALHPDSPTVGAWVELGYALAHGKPVVAYLHGLREGSGRSDNPYREAPEATYWHDRLNAWPWLYAPGVRRAGNLEQLVGYLRLIKGPPARVIRVSPPGATAPESVVAEMLGAMALARPGIEAEV